MCPEGTVGLSQHVVKEAGEYTGACILSIVD